MSTNEWNTTSLAGVYQRMHAGDGTAREDLLRCIRHRWERLAYRMLRGSREIGQRDRTEIALQDALLALTSSLDDAGSASARQFFNAAAERMRHGLLDLVQHLRGSEGLDDGDTLGPDASPRPVPQAGAAKPSSDNLGRWCAFHLAIDQLPAAEREVVCLAFYHEGTRQQIAELLQASEQTVRRCWVSACVRLHEQLQGHLPQG